MFLSAGCAGKTLRIFNGRKYNNLDSQTHNRLEIGDNHNPPCASVPSESVITGGGPLEGLPPFSDSQYGFAEQNPQLFIKKLKMANLPCLKIYSKFFKNALPVRFFNLTKRANLPGLQEQSNIQNFSNILHTSIYDHQYILPLVQM